ncbi:MAG TPA: S-methyl-5-thioribose-1-phosphate isomerase [Solirubrobacteraceae bacterium]|nr:S-methyl-5-thioribose-1-phosphate isomerase [Solirubrobacteraceae bacterium]
MATTAPVVALHYADGALRAIDQTQLPWREVELELRSADDVAGAIRRLSIRGAPLIGVAAAYGVALELARDPDALERACTALAGARPTAVNLAHAVGRVRAAVVAAGDAGAAGATGATGGTGAAGDAGAAGVALSEARALHAEEEAASDAIARHGADLMTGRRRILTHCNTGALAAPGRGTALAVIAEMADRGELELVLAAESRPLLQGARLTVYELGRLGIEHALVVDGAGAGLIAAGEVDAVIVGCDRVAANGDVANKVGTYAHALAAAAAGIPFVVAGPCTTIDRACPSGAEIVIEERDGAEVRSAGLWRDEPLWLTVAGTPCRNPAFDVTPAGLVTALVTERGVAAPPTRASVSALLGA